MRSQSGFRRARPCEDMSPARAFCRAGWTSPTLSWKFPRRVQEASYSECEALSGRKQGLAAAAITVPPDGRITQGRTIKRRGGMQCLVVRALVSHRGAVRNEIT